MAIAGWDDPVLRYAASMQRISLVCRTLLAAIYLAGCGSGDDGEPEMQPFEAPPMTTPAPAPATPDPAAPDPATPDGATGDEGTDPDLDLDPAEPPIAEQRPDEPLAPGVMFGNGRLVNGMCTLVCATDATDPDAQGVTQGVDGRVVHADDGDLALPLRLDYGHDCLLDSPVRQRPRPA